MLKCAIGYKEDINNSSIHIINIINKNSRVSYILGMIFVILIWIYPNSILKFQDFYLIT